jgi:hypothetical protein
LSACLTAFHCEDEFFESQCLVKKIIKDVLEAGFTFVQLVYSIALSPALVAASVLRPSLHHRLATPLLSGPYRGKLIDDIWRHIYSLQRASISQEEFISRIASEMCAAYEAGELDPFLRMADEGLENLDITLARCLGFLPLKWWYLKLHFMAPGNVHQLHRHRTVISAQVIIRGSLKARQFNLVDIQDDSIVALEPVPIEPVNGYQVLLSTDGYCNVHGFEPCSTGALRFQFYLRGHDKFLKRNPKRGRRYIELLDRLDESGNVLGRLGRDGAAGES